MDVKDVFVSESITKQSGGTRRKGRRKPLRQQTQQPTLPQQPPAPQPTPATQPTPQSQPAQPQPKPKPNSQQPVQVIIAPAKKKLPKVVLVPKTATTTTAATAAVAPTKPPRIKPKTFKSKRVSMIVDNTRKAKQHRTTVLSQVDSLTDEQVREAAVTARLSQPKKVETVPIELLRQMVKDYQIIKGRLNG